MGKLLIRVDGALSDELTNAFPNLSSRRAHGSTTLVGDVTDQEELLGVLNMLNALGVAVIEVVTIPED